MSAMLMTGTRRTQLQDLHRSQRECEAYWRLPDPPFYQQGGLQGAPYLLESLPTTFRDSPRARNGRWGAPRRRPRSPTLEVEQCSTCPRGSLGPPVAVKSWAVAANSCPVAANSCPVAASFSSRGHRDRLRNRRGGQEGASGRQLVVPGRPLRSSRRLEGMLVKVKEKATSCSEGTAGEDRSSSLSS